MFARECEMRESVYRWLNHEALDVKREFVLPWGICDFVGVKLDPIQVNKRVEYGQMHAIGPLHRVELLLRIPDVESGKAISLKQLQKVSWTLNSGFDLEEEVRRLVAARFVVQRAHGMFQKLNGWSPLHSRIVAVELKLSRISEALAQATSHRVFATESYVGMPREIAERVAFGERSVEFSNAGVGILAVSKKNCEVILPILSGGLDYNPALQLHCVERFWRTRGSSS